MTLLQHNAAINPGNSGGALFDMAGNLVGIVNAKKFNTGIEGLGFAIPVNIAFEYFKGVMNASSIGATVDYGYNSKHVYGVYVVSVTENSQFKLNDRIVKINGVDISNLNDYYATIDEFKSGDTIKVTIVRRNIEVDLTITLQ
jgi:serine protease Do